MHGRTLQSGREPLATYYEAVLFVAVLVQIHFQHDVFGPHERLDHPEPP